MKTFRTIFFAILLLNSLVLVGCVVVTRHRYNDVIADLTATGSKNVGVATYDQREYIISGNKRSTFVGLQRGGFGIPINVSTDSNKSLAEDMTQAISNSLKKKGFQSIEVIVSASDDRDKVQKKLKASQGERLVLLSINEWKSDSFQNTALNYDLTLFVLNQDGQTIAETSVVGKDNLGGSFWNPSAHARTAVPKALKKKLEELLNHADVVAALQ